MAHSPVGTPSVAELSGPRAHAALARLRGDRPVARIAALDAWLVTRHDLAVQVVRDAATFTVDDPRFSTGRVVGASMLSLDGADHRRHRSAFASAFRPRQVTARFGDEVERWTADLLARVRADGAADLRAALAAPLSVAAVADALGLAAVEATTVLGWYRDIVDAVTVLSSGGSVGPAAGAAMQALDAHVRASLADAPVLHEAVGVLSVDEIVSNAAVMMFGGIETTEAMISNALVHVLSSPTAAAALRADPALVELAVEESLRLEPAAAVVDRYATRAVHLGPAAIARGDLVRVSIAAANRDPAVFADPDTFDLTRTNLRSQLAFAQGPHVCIAADLARLETRTALSAVLRLPGVRLDGPAGAEGLIFRKPAAVPVRWDVPTAD